MRDIDLKYLSGVPTATGGIARHAYARARKAGIELRPILEKAGLTEQHIKDRDSRILVRSQIDFLNLIADAVRDRLLGFHLAESIDLRELGLLYYVAASSETLGDVLQRVARFGSITNEGLSLQYRAAADIKIEFGYVGVARHLDRHQIEFSMTLLMRLCRKLVGRRLVPSRLRFTHHRGDEGSEVAAFFGAKCDFAAGVDELTLTRETKDMVVVSSDPYLNNLLVATFEEALSRRRASRSSFQSAVENAIVPLLPHGKARAPDVALRLGVSQRTSARRLSLEGLTFSEVLDSLRCDLARRYLADEKLSISRIAWLLGFQEVSSFTNAFKRWTGTTPRQARVIAGI